MSVAEWSEQLRKLCPDISIGKIRHDKDHGTIRIRFPKGSRLPGECVLSDMMSPGEASKYLHWKREEYKGVPK